MGTVFDHNGSVGFAAESCWAEGTNASTGPLHKSYPLGWNIFSKCAMKLTETYFVALGRAPHTKKAIGIGEILSVHARGALV